MMRTISTFALVLLCIGLSAQESKNTEEVVFQCNIHCANCEDKIMKNIPFEKGVKDVKVDSDQKLILVSYRTDKNNPDNLKKAFEKLEFTTSIKGKAMSIGVKGACDMCKKRIEEASLSVTGVSVASWSEKDQRLTLVFDTNQTDLNSIQTAIAKVGHDTDSIKAEDAVYNNLHDCCKYKR